MLLELLVQISFERLFQVATDGEKSVIVFAHVMSVYYPEGFQPFILFPKMKLILDLLLWQKKVRNFLHNLFYSAESQYKLSSLLHAAEK